MYTATADFGYSSRDLHMNSVIMWSHWTVTDTETQVCTGTETIPEQVVYNFLTTSPILHHHRYSYKALFINTDGKHDSQYQDTHSTWQWIIFLTLTNCLLNTPSEPWQEMIFGRFIPPARVNVDWKPIIEIMSLYSQVGSTCSIKTRQSSTKFKKFNQNFNSYFKVHAV